MQVNGKEYTSIWQNESDGSIQVIDQRWLPFELKTFNLKNYQDAYYAIKEMVVRGAPLIGVTAAYGVYLAAREDTSKSNILKAASHIKSARPTAVNLESVVNEMTSATEGLNSEIPTSLLERANHIRQREIDNCKAIGENGLPLIKEIYKVKHKKQVNILTHCNAGWLACVDYGTALAPLYMASKENINIHVWVDETRPRNQGARLTAWELSQAGIPHTVIPDNTGGLLMRNQQVDLVIVGSDRTTKDGDVVNKIGTYLKALAAFDNGIPFYVALPLSSFDTNIHASKIPIEQRNENEVRFVEGWKDTKVDSVRIITDDSPVANFGFDITPARLVTALITEKGICKPKKDEILKLFS